jgi:hypothetical protein
VNLLRYRRGSVVSLKVIPSPAAVRHPHHHIFVKVEGDLMGED